jgi:O-methyltransferase involved in polyketide biosynthesis
LSAPKRGGDLSVTALYTSHTWLWSRQPGAELLATPEAKVVFRVTNAALAVARLFFWRLPSLKHSLVQRHVMIDRIAHESGARQVLELAAGLSRRGLSFTADASITYTEVDLAAVVARKRELLERTAAGRAVLARPNLRFVAGDVREIALEPLALAGHSLLVVSEGLFMYLAAAEQRALWTRIAALLRHCGGGTFVFDLVPACEQPRPGLVGRVLGSLMKRFTGGKAFVRDERTRADIIAELTTAGFREVRLIEPRELARSWSLPFAERRTQQLLFVCSVAV